MRCDLPTDSGVVNLEEMLKPEQDSRMADTVIAQPSNFLIQVGLTALWRSLGVEPVAIIGHSVGEVTAAYVAGVLTLEEALLVSYHRSRIQKKAAGTGKMLAVSMSQEQCLSVLRVMTGEISIAAINSPTSLTLAGDALALQVFQETIAQRGESGRFLQVEVPYHSPFMEPLKPEMRSVLDRLQPQAPNIPLYSTVTGDAVTGVLYDAEYWCRQYPGTGLFRERYCESLAGRPSDIFRGGTTSGLVRLY